MVRAQSCVSKPATLLQEPHAIRALLFIFGGRRGGNKGMTFSLECQHKLEKGTGLASTEYYCLVSGLKSSIRE